MTWKELLQGQVNHGKVSTPSDSGLSDLFDRAITIINQIPTSPTVPTKTAWKKHTLTDCAVVNGLFDKSSGNMQYKANTFTVYAPWEHYREPTFNEDGYYNAYTNDSLFTANVGDLVVLQEIDDEEPTTLAEFNALRAKYQNNGGILTTAEAFIKHYKSGEPWGINHIEMIKG